MKILDILHDSIVDGEGLRVVIFFAGCSHKCKGCHNPQSWNIDYGLDYTIDEAISSVISNKITKNVTFSGGDPLFQIKDATLLIKELKKLGYNIWVYTGFTYEEIMLNKNMTELLHLTDVLVDGRYEDDKKDLTLRFRGSSNQRIIDVKKSLKESKIVLYGQ